MTKMSLQRGLTTIAISLICFCANSCGTSESTDVEVHAIEGNPILPNIRSKILHVETASVENGVLNMNSDYVLLLYCSVQCDKGDTDLHLSVGSDNQELLDIVGNSTFSIDCSSDEVQLVEWDSTDLAANVLNGNETEVTPNVSQPMMLPILKKLVKINVQSRNIGIASLVFSIVRTQNDSVKYHTETQSWSDELTRSGAVNNSGNYVYQVKVLRIMRPVDTIFRVVLYSVQILVGIGFGAKLDLQVVKNNLVRPVGPVIGFVCQYLLMPLIAFSITKAIDVGDPVVAFGLFIAGCCPGGGASNMYSYLLNGDLSLSITMTAISTVAALGILPAWIYTLGSVYLTGNNITIPFTTVLISLCILICPLIAGVLLRLKFNKAADTIGKILKPITAVMVLVLLVIGIYSNWFLFRMFKPRILLAGCLLPYMGYFVGGTVSGLFKQEWTKVKTIAIETGLQNTNIAYILLTTSFPPPYGDIAAIAPVASAVMTPIPLFVVTVCYLIYQRCKKAYEPVAKEENGVSLKDMSNKA